MAGDCNSVGVVGIVLGAGGSRCLAVSWILYLVSFGYLCT
jgi:hypothetical protein